MGEHPGIPKAIDYGVKDGKPFVVWERINGVSLDEEYRVNQKTMTLEEIRDCLQQVADILVPLHRKGIAHLDSGPPNIINVAPGQVPEYALINWHVAKPSWETYSNSAYAYLPPELDQPSLGQPGPQSDVYMVAYTLYVLYTGRSPFRQGEIPA